MLEPIKEYLAAFHERGLLNISTSFLTIAEFITLSTALACIVILVILYLISKAAGY